MPGFRPVAVIVHPDIQAQYDQLEAEARRGTQPAQAVWKAFRTAVARVKADGQWGEVIPRAGIPARFVRAYGVSNLYCVDLAGFRRCFYTIRHRDVIFLDIVDHPTYDRWFGGRRR